MSELTKRWLYVLGILLACFFLLFAFFYFADRASISERHKLEAFCEDKEGYQRLETSSLGANFTKLVNCLEVNEYKRLISNRGQAQ